MRIIGVIIVTYNSKRFLKKCVKSLLRGDVLPAQIIVIDNASQDTNYLNDILNQFSSAKIIKLENNIGFAAANNLGLKYLNDEINYVLFLNPDCFVAVNLLQEATNLMETLNTRNVAILTGKLLSFDIDKNCPVGTIDSCGIFYTRYGRFYDRGQGEIDQGQYDKTYEDIPAACGALIFCQRNALKEMELSDGQVFDETFFMYKEDIDLCLRAKENRRRIGYSSRLIAYHCRGWQDRKLIPYWAKRTSVLNEWRILCKGFLPKSIKLTFLIYLLLKSTYVFLIESNWWNFKKETK